MAKKQDKKDPKKLNAQQKRFALEYVIDYNATKAAVRAGYSEKTAGSQGSRLLKNAEVLACVREKQKEMAEKLCISAEWVVQHLVEVVNKAMQAQAVEVWNYQERCMKPTGEYVFDSRGAAKALELIGKHIGMYTEKVELGGLEGKPFEVNITVVDDTSKVED